MTIVGNVKLSSTPDKFSFSLPHHQYEQHWVVGLNCDSKLHKELCSKIVSGLEGTINGEPTFIVDESLHELLEGLVERLGAHVVFMEAVERRNHVLGISRHVDHLQQPTTNARLALAGNPRNVTERQTTRVSKLRLKYSNFNASLYASQSQTTGQSRCFKRSDVTYIVFKPPPTMLASTQSRVERRP